MFEYMSMMFVSMNMTFECMSMQFEYINMVIECMITVFECTEMKCEYLYKHDGLICEHDVRVYEYNVSI